MPPKRKTLNETTTNTKMNLRPRNNKAAKKDEGSNAPESSASKAKAGPQKGEGKKAPKERNNQEAKTDNEKNSPSKVAYVNLEWPNYEDFMDDENQDVPKVGALIDPYVERVSDLGIPVSEYGEKTLRKIDKELGKRDQDRRGMYIYNDWNGWGVLQVLENLLAEFNGLAKKEKRKGKGQEVKSVWEIWGIAEGLSAWVKGDGELVTMNDDADGASEVIDMIGLMLLTALETLHDHDLFKPDSEVKNLAIVCLMLIEFCDGPCTDFDLEWPCEIVRLCDNAGIKLEDHVRKQVDISKDRVEELREQYLDKKGEDFSEKGQEDTGDAYAFFEKMDGWKPKDDKKDEVGEGMSGLNKMWYRWDWKLEYPPFFKNHKGGDCYDLSKWSKKKKAQYLLGSGSEEESDDDRNGWTDSESGN